MGQIRVRLMVLFPYSARTGKVFDILADVLAAARDHGLHTSDRQPLLVVNRDSSREKHFKAFEDHLATKEYHGRAKQRLVPGSYEVHDVWADDTCAMWLSGWGRIMEDNWKLPRGKRD